MSWTDERIDQLKSLWEQGMTASQIADSLGGVSRNAVIGKAHRLGLQSRPSPVRSADAGSDEPAAPPPAAAKADPAPPSRRAAAAQAAPEPAPAAAPVTSLHEPVAPASPPAPPRRLVPAKPSAEVKDKTGLLDLNDKICKWPIGHPGEPDFHFCGHPVNQGFPYCMAHCAVAYQAQLPRRDRRPPPLPFGGPRMR
jgi:GcrA cell cycle regulator